MNEKLVNLGLSEIDVELLENHETKLNDFQVDLLPSLFNYVIRELNNLENLINDPKFLQEYKFTRFSENISYDLEKGFKTSISTEYRKKSGNYHHIYGNIAESSPKRLFRNYSFGDYENRMSGRDYNILSDVKAFNNWILKIKKDYLRHIHELQKVENQICEIIFNE